MAYPTRLGIFREGGVGGYFGGRLAALIRDAETGGKRDGSGDALRACLMAVSR